MDTRMITGDAVRHALRAVRFAKPLGDNPLLELDTLAAWLAGQGEADSRAGRDSALGPFLADVIWEQLCRIRGNSPSPRRPELTPEAELALLCRDFQVGKTEIEAWSLLYHRYLAADRTPVGEVAKLLGLTEKTLERRLNRGHELLAARLRQLEGRVALAPSSARPSITAPAPGALPGGSLPLPLTDFVGREVEVSTLCRLVAEDRLLTLTGPGGIGKTRLGLELGRTVADAFAGGVWLVELAAVTEDAQVPRALAQVLGLREDPGQPLVDALVAHLQDPARLIILDNCEHLREACGILVAALLARCKTLHVLATSREPLRLVGEQLWPVAPLALPDAADAADPTALADFEAVALFTARAREAQPGFALTRSNAATVARICTRLDGIPLALELAAARVRALDVAEIDRRLDQRFRLLTRGASPTVARHQALRAAVDWGYDLLDDSERMLLRRLAVFRGGWALDAAEAVCGEDGSDALDVLDGLTALVDKSFVMPGRTGEGGRFRLLETIREYAWDRLVASGEAHAICDLHLAWCTALAEAAEPELVGVEQVAWLNRLDAERDNLRSALLWSVERGMAEGGLRLGGALARFWSMRGHLTEGRARLAGVLALPCDAVQPWLRSKVLMAAGELARKQSDYVMAQASLQEALEAQRAGGDRAGMARTLRILGNTAEELGRRVEARDLYQQALDLYRGLGDLWGTAAALNNLGLVAYHEGDFTHARQLFLESNALFQSLGEKWAVGITLSNLGRVAFDAGNAGEAQSLHQASLKAAQEIDDKEGIAAALIDLAEISVKAGDYSLARQQYAKGLGILEDLGDLKRIAEWLEAMAMLERRDGQPARAVRLWAAATSLRDAVGVPVAPKGIADRDTELVSLRSAIGETPYAELWAMGAATEWQAVVDDAPTNGPGVAVSVRDGQYHDAPEDRAAASLETCLKKVVFREGANRETS